MTRQAREALKAAQKFIEDDTCRHDSEKVEVLRKIAAALFERDNAAEKPDHPHG